MSEQTIATRLEELERTAAENDKRPLVGRILDEPWGTGWPDSTPVELTLGALREIVGRLADLQETPEFIAMLRAKGVTRYRRGDLEIELSQGKPDPEQVDNGEPWPGAYSSLARAAREAGWLDEAGQPTDKLRGLSWAPQVQLSPADDSADNEPSDPPADEQPPVEIDMAAVEERLREQDAKRRGPSE